MTNSQSFMNHVKEQLIFHITSYAMRFYKIFDSNMNSMQKANNGYIKNYINL